MHISNPNLKDTETSSSFGVLKFNSKGCVEVSDEAAEQLLQVPGFERCEDCDCGAKKSETKKAPASVVEVPVEVSKAPAPDAIKEKIAGRGRPKKGQE